MEYSEDSLDMSILNDYIEYLNNNITKYGKQTIVLMQVGMFHEFYGVDNEYEKIGYVKEVSEILNIQMTRRDKKNPENNRKNWLMAGFPSVSIDRYINILLEHGYTIAVVDQLTEAPNVTRGVTRICSPGTYIEDCRKSDNNFLISIFLQSTSYTQKGANKTIKKNLLVGLSAVDLTTAEAHIYEAWSNPEDSNFALDETYRFLQAHTPREIVIYTADLEDLYTTDELVNLLELHQYVYHFRAECPKDYRKIEYQNQFFRKVFNNNFGQLNPIEWLDLENKPISVLAYLLNLQFAWEHNEKIVNNLKKPDIWEQQDHLILANNAIIQLSLDSPGSNTSVFTILNKTSTAMGRRLLKHRLLNPIISHKTLNNRYDLVESMRNKVSDSYDINLSQNQNRNTEPQSNNEECDVYKYEIYENYLRAMNDIERLHRRISLKLIQPCEFNTMDTTYKLVNKIFKLIGSDTSLANLLGLKELVMEFNELQKYYESVLNLEETYKYNLTNLSDSFFKVGYNQELDRISYEIRHYNQYFHQVSKALSNMISPNSDFVTIKSTDEFGYIMTTTANRWKLLQKAWSNPITVTVDKEEYSLSIEDLQVDPISKKSNNYNIFAEKFEKISDKLKELQGQVKTKTTSAYIEFLGQFYSKWQTIMDQVCVMIAQIDVAKSSAKASIKYHYARPVIDLGNEGKNSYLDAKGLRHPIIERINQKCLYVPHNIALGKPHSLSVPREEEEEEDRESKVGDSHIDGRLIYGVNSCGKSSLMKSVGVNLVMAQAGMYVAADSFSYYPYQYILTRIIGNDNLSKGLSSFAVEMSELRGILKRASSRSLILGDEICHGTETISAISIVASAVNHLAKKGASFLFATHLHQLSNMEEIKRLSNVSNHHLRVIRDPQTGDLIYDRQLMPGSGDPIYGLEVAKAMGLSGDFIEEADKIRRKLLDISDEILSTRKSHFNPGIYLDKCQICGQKAEETHHIGFQCTAGDDNFIGHYHKNIMANLVPLCQTCHMEVHAKDSKLIIEGYKETSSGLQFRQTRKK